MAGWVKLLKHHTHTDKFNVDVDLGVNILLEIISERRW